MPAGGSMSFDATTGLLEANPFVVGILVGAAVLASLIYLLASDRRGSR